MSGIITGKLRLEMRPVDLLSVVIAAMDTVRPAAEAKGVALESAFDRSAEPVLGDSDRLQQVVSNLLSNAIKFTPSGGKATVSFGRSGSEVVLKVADTGKGIPPLFLARVFDTFSQADSSTTRSHQSLGLGLTIARHITELHGGRLQAESAGEGKGATFSVRLPIPTAARHRTPSSGSGATVESKHEVLPSLEGLNVLIVDDEADTLDLVMTLLEQQGARVTRAASAAEAWDSLLSSKPDVLLTDIAMPGEDGYEFIRRVRALGIKIPAGALTAYAGPEDKIRASSAGFQTHLAKPVDPADLINAVAELAGRR